jgi:uncharacterized repeat protein (TIGR01451 family)
MKPNFKFPFVLIMAILAGFGALFSASVWARAAGSWYVTSSGDDTQDCSTAATPCATINAAIGKALAGDTIYIATGIYTSSNGSEVVLLDKSVDLSGGWNTEFDGQVGKSTIDAEGKHRGLTNSSSTARIDHLIIQNGGNTFEGAGLINHGSIILEDSQISNNVTARLGGGISNYSLLTINDSLITENLAGSPGRFRADGYGAGILNYTGATLSINNSVLSNNRILSWHQGTGSAVDNRGTLIINNSTISGNRGASSLYGFFANTSLNSVTVTQNDGGILQAYDNALTLQNSILAGNNTLDCYADIQTIINDLGYNIIQKNERCLVGNTDMSSDPRLLALQDNGGGTPTHGLAPGSPAINAGNPAGCLDGAGKPLLSDQRGATRIANCDIGAFEAGLTLNKQVTGALYRGGVATYKLKLQNIANNIDLTNVTFTDTLPGSLTVISRTVTTDNGSTSIDKNTIYWNGTVFSTTGATIQFNAAISQTIPLGSWITNTAESRWAGLPAFSQVSFDTSPRIYLPLCLKYLCDPNSFDNFSDPASGWPVGVDKTYLVEYLNGEYHILPKLGYTLFMFRSPWCGGDNYSVEVDARWESGPATYGLIFGALPDFSRFYIFEISTNGQRIGLYRHEESGWVTLLPSQWISNINPGTAPNHLFASHRGKIIRVEVNGSGFEYEDTNGIFGKTGAGVFATQAYFSPPITDARFDNFKTTWLPPSTSSQLFKTPALQTNYAITTTNPIIWPDTLPDW